MTSSRPSRRSNDAPARAAELFHRDEMLQVWVVYHVQLIGEAASRLSEGLRARYPHVPWPDISAMRNMLVRHYFSTDLDQVWYTVEHDLPRLKEWVQQALADTPA